MPPDPNRWRWCPTCKTLSSERGPGRLCSWCDGETLPSEGADPDVVTRRRESTTTAAQATQLALPFTELDDMRMQPWV